MNNFHRAIDLILSWEKKYPEAWENFEYHHETKNPTSVESWQANTEAGGKTLNAQKGDSEGDCN